MESKKFKHNNLESNDKSLLRPATLIANSQVNDTMPINIKETALVETPIADKQRQQDISKSINQKYDALTKKKESTKKAKLHIKLKQNKLNEWLNQRSFGKVDEVNHQGQDKVKEQTHMQKYNVQEKGMQKLKEHKQEQDQELHILKNSIPNIKQTQKKKHHIILASSLQKNKQIKLITPPETSQTNDEHQTKMEGEMYRVHQVPNFTNAALVLKFKKIHSENVNYKEVSTSKYTIQYSISITYTIYDVLRVMFLINSLHMGNLCNSVKP
jgi:hypothetical protein